MPGDENADDIPAIKALIARQFASLSWTESRPANWDEFAADFHPEASLYPSARPVKRQTIEGFLERMKGLAGATLSSLEEAMPGEPQRRDAAPGQGCRGLADRSAGLGR